ncbi:MAG: aspartate carbamoyltransferase catalytic subunit [Limisphaerales bacterium]
MTWNRPHLLDIESLSPAELNTVLDTARAFKLLAGRNIKSEPYLRGKTVINLFVEPSTRTRISFQLAAQRLSADVVNFTAESSSLKKGETLRDTARNLEAMNADIVVIRHQAAGAPHFLARFLRSHVINAGDGAHEHPTQALLDIFTIREHQPSLKGLQVVILGDILFSRVARSNIWALRHLGAEVTVAGPRTLVPDHFAALGCRLASTPAALERALAEADVVNLLRIQHERQRRSMFPGIGEYRALFGLDAERMRRLKPEVIIMHPGPINRGVEIDSDTADGPRSVILEQVANGVAVRMAVLYLVSGGDPALGRS